MSDSNNNKLKNSDIIFYIDEEYYLVTTNDNGQASIQISEDPGTYDVLIQYFGDDTYDESHKTIKLTIKQQQTNHKTNVIINLGDCKVNNKLKISLKSSNKKPLSKKRIYIKIGSKKTFKKKLNKKGEYTLSKKLTKKPAKIKVIYKGNNNYNSKSKIAYIYNVIKIKNLKKSCGVNKKFTMSIKSPSNLRVYLKISNKVYKINFKKRKATFNPKDYNLKKGKKYTLKFSSKRGKYCVNQKHTLKIK